MINVRKKHLLTKVVKNDELPAWLIEQLNDDASVHHDDRGEEGHDRPRLYKHVTIKDDRHIEKHDEENETIINIPLRDVESGYST